YSWVIEIEVGSVGPLSSVAVPRHCPDTAPGLRNNLPDKSFLRDKRSISPGWNFLGNHPKRNILRRAYSRAYHEGVRAIRVALIIDIDCQDVRINLVGNLAQQAFFHEAIPLLWNDTLPRHLVCVTGRD